MNNNDIISFVSSLAERGKQFVLATVINAEGSTLAKPGFKVVFSEEGEVLYGTLGGACPENAISSHVESVAESGSPKVVKVHLEQAENSILEMNRNVNIDEIFVETFCGGTIEIFLEPFMSKKRMVIIKQGGKEDLADLITKMSPDLGMLSHIVDLSDLKTGPDGNIIEPLDSVKYGENDCVVILTKGNDDLKVLEHLSKFKPGYIGLLASRKRSEYDFKQLKGKVSDSFLKKIHTPIGMDIGAVTPGEIAISIFAEVISLNRSENGKKLKITSKN